MEIVQPSGWPRPKGYSNACIISGRLLLISGIIGWDENEHIVSDDLLEQFEQICKNINIILSTAGASSTNIARLNWFITDMPTYRANLVKVGEIYRRHFGKHFPAMTAVGVASLVEPRAKCEIEAIAVLND